MKQVNSENKSNNRRNTGQVNSHRYYLHWYWYRNDVREASATGISL